MLERGTTMLERGRRMQCVMIWRAGACERESKGNLVQASVVACLVQQFNLLSPHPSSLILTRYTSPQTTESKGVNKMAGTELAGTELEEVP